ncbi:MAG TPA: DNA-protecting protein DprA [Candidatus Cybelea sp.]|jgi:DNA processing protein
MEPAMHEPIFETRERIEAARTGRGFEAVASGLWCAGTLDGLARPCVAIVGTRAATAYGRGVARRWAAELGRAGCGIISGLALGIDAAAHEGALDAGAPTVGIIGGGHRCFFPRRNLELAERMLAAGGAVLSPYPPAQVARPGQFLQRNGIVAALCDAVVVVEAPERSGALNTAGWAAGRIPVLAVPGDVDRKHVQGCLALIRDGATLARGPADVLEALGRLHLRAAPQTALSSLDPASATVLRALEEGPADLDAIVAAAHLPAHVALSVLAVLELDGAIESRGAGTFARVGVLPNGEEQAR